jgi:hypothetical protein
MAMYLRSSLSAPTPVTRTHPAMVVAWVCAVVTILFGIYPKPLLEASWRAFEAVRGG